ncbi:MULTISPECIES: DUF72 domain-containing protein [unclassified Imperialibacter]|uniref:DUF72 domain-containing protein n=1 Tax=unclassified Imperialibacter TaxID=2629706 RepID=UPI0012515E63|nr:MULTISPECIES: DUF72 domain-containing protein [unclassified Imperialibacter]CAD5257355.1 conserved hypothetical protein [Imperialibacter sp. 75]CAD5260235.1 conserved hypothetical protein [Imperialibacter sp. 89]VVT25677.1 conserved hypothetical protein [Imperialibacter sp. EC-SDR9]
MKFGSVPDPGIIDFTIPSDHPDTAKVLSKGNGSFEAFVGCAKWNKTDLKNFYPKGTKDELSYYSTQFNSIELNATFYNSPKKDQVLKWKEKTPDDFKFFPKLTNSISHFKRLIDTKQVVDEYCDAISGLEEKLGMVFLQMHDNFKPKDFDRVIKFIDEFPKVIPLAIEVRNEDWFTDPASAEKFYQLLEDKGVANVLVDTAGRRDMMHMRLTTPHAFVRYVGANHPTDYPRLDDWLVRIKAWKEQGLEKLYFFIHQNIELESPLLSAYFIKKMNEQLGTNLTMPKTLND